MAIPENHPLFTPRLRNVEAFPVQMDGQEMICLRDPYALAEEPVFLNQALVFLVSRMDGGHTLREIQADFLQASSEILPIEDLESIVTQLDRKHYLDSPELHAHYQNLVQAYQDAPSRPPRHAGSAYAKDRDALAAQLHSCFVHPEGPGALAKSGNGAPLRGLIAPHIDFARGGPVYAHAYKALADHPGADTFIIFGTCHTPMPQRFSISDKDYDTPLGPACTDKDFVGRLAARLGNNYRHEFAHRGEHSIEFQAVWLKYILPASGFKIVPLLVNSFHDIYGAGRTAAEDPEIQGVVKALRETMRETPGRICIIAGVDLAHIGRQFGDADGPSESYLQEVAAADEAFLKLVEGLDAEGMFQSIAADNDRRRVCGYSSIYMALRCLDAPGGKLLKYRQWSDRAAAVTYAALAFF